MLIDVILTAVRGHDGSPRLVSDQDDDPDGSATVQVLNKTLGLMRRITGNDCGSLGLHPAVYFYGPTGRHSGAMFMGTLTLIARKLANNDGTFFKKFTSVRAKLEAVLVEHKDLIATILQKHSSRARADRYANVLDQTIETLLSGETITERDLVTFAGLDGKIVTGTVDLSPVRFTEDVKSEVFIDTALKSAVKCPVCGGYLDTVKSVSYDHVKRVQDGGNGAATNLQLTHPYCNQSIKN